jgi:hypothetical protein
LLLIVLLAINILPAGTYPTLPDTSILAIPAKTYSPTAQMRPDDVTIPERY